VGLHIHEFQTRPEGYLDIQRSIDFIDIPGLLILACVRFGFVVLANVAIPYSCAATTCSCRWQCHWAAATRRGRALALKISILFSDAADLLVLPRPNGAAARDIRDTSRVQLGAIDMSDDQPLDVRAGTRSTTAHAFCLCEPPLATPQQRSALSHHPPPSGTRPSACKKTYNWNVIQRRERGRALQEASGCSGVRLVQAEKE
jgi:hypothetical protein